MNLLRSYTIAIIAMVLHANQAYTQSAIELMEDTASWENYEPHVGGTLESDLDNISLYSEESIDLGLWSLEDSLARIPAYDMYCDWDTKNLFEQKEAKDALAEPLSIVLCREACDFVYPANGLITSPFGPRWGRMHYGLDIDLETGDPVWVAFEGMVRISQYHASYGNVVVVRHANGLETLYAHLSQRHVKPGDYLQAGDQIGLGGNTGRSYGAHLHFEVRFMGDAINPALLVDPNQKSLRDWEFVLHKSHFNHSAAVAEFNKDASKARRESKKFHTVKRGETLSAIARKRGTSVSALCKLNKLRETSIIREGQKLRYR